MFCFTKETCTTLIYIYILQVYLTNIYYIIPIKGVVLIQKAWPQKTFNMSKQHPITVKHCSSILSCIGLLTCISNNQSQLNATLAQSNQKNLKPLFPNGPPLTYESWIKAYKWNEGCDRLDLQLRDKSMLSSHKRKQKRIELR